MDVDLRVLSDTPEDMTLLRRFYDDIYLKSFLDDDERLTFQVLASFIKKDSFCIVLALTGGEVVGGSVSMYCFGEASGVIAFIATREVSRSMGVGRCMLEYTEKTLASRGKLDLLIAEIENPHTYDRPSVISLKERVRIWQKYGFLLIGLDYTQPALSLSQRPVQNLWLIAKTNGVSKVSASVLLNTIEEYFHVAMSIKNPKECPEYQNLILQIGGNDGIVLSKLI